MAWHHRLWNVVRRRDPADDIEEELQFHIEAATRANVASGMSREQARQDALRRFGNAAAIRERARDADVLRILDDLRHDLAFAFRSLRKRPGFACVALLTLALGIGATTAIFTVVRSVLLRPLPFPAADALHVISFWSPDPLLPYSGMSDAGYLEFREANRTFESIATFSEAQSTLTGVGDAARLRGALVTTDFFRVLGVAAAAGRTFGAADEGTGSERVVLVGDGLWRGRFGADPGLLERSIVLNGLPHRVIGILPAGFSFPADATYWVPLTVRTSPNRSYTRPVIGRLKAGVTREQALADLDAWARNLPADSRRPRDFVANVKPLHDAIVGNVRRPLLVFGGAVALVLLIVCANVANLLLMRAVSRRQEIATRLALGAGRGRLVRQLLTESALLSILGGCAGTAFAMLAGPALLAVIPGGRLPQDIAIRPDGWVLAFTAGLSVLTGVIVGLAPIAQTTRNNQYAAIRSGVASATRASFRVRHGLVVAQIALTLMLLVGAGLLLRSFAGLRSVPLGFAPQSVVTMTVDLPETRYPAASDAAGFHDRLLAEITALPGVRSVAAVNWLPLGDMRIGGDVYAEDRPDLSGQYSATKVAVSPAYFETIGIRVLRGRAFTSQDRHGSQPVIVVSESVARRLWPGGDPLGKRVSVEDQPKPEDWLTVVGVVEDVRQGGFRDTPGHAVYQPYSQVTRRFFLGFMTFLARMDGDPSIAAPLIRAALNRVDPNEAPQSLATLESVLDRSVAEQKFQARVLTVFSVMGLFLAAIGIYGVLASSVLERRFEIGVRLALGADKSSVMLLVLRRAMLLTAAGALLGLGGALALTGILQSLLFNVTPTDAATFLVATVVLIAAALIATFLPARRASSIDPLLALRVD